MPEHVHPHFHHLMLAAQIGFSYLQNVGLFVRLHAETKPDDKHMMRVAIATCLLEDIEKIANEAKLEYSPLYSMKGSPLVLNQYALDQIENTVARFRSRSTQIRTVNEYGEVVDYRPLFAV